ncbi:hypothetical protein D3C84_922800 [compost metagenome]
MLAQQIIIIATLQAFGPFQALGGRQTVEDGDGGRRVVLEIAQHGRLGAFVAFVVLGCERQGLGEYQTDQEHQPQPRGQRARPLQREFHACSSSISTAKVKT